VGFSYSNTMSDYQMDNNKTADDNFAALELWLQRFPAFQGKKTWISGESYAGDYGGVVLITIVPETCDASSLLCDAAQCPR
jgi:carboxypeptidase C (cathepsin A)